MKVETAALPNYMCFSSLGNVHIPSPCFALYYVPVRLGRCRPKFIFHGKLS